jgi:hypothetical protein
MPHGSVALRSITNAESYAVWHLPATGKTNFVFRCWTAASGATTATNTLSPAIQVYSATGRAVTTLSNYSYALAGLSNAVQISITNSISSATLPWAFGLTDFVGSLGGPEYLYYWGFQMEMY